MQYTISVCDDEKFQIDIIKKYIERFNENKEYEIHLLTACSGEELLEKLNNLDNKDRDSKNIDIFFLDIEMKGIDGVELGRRLRKKNKDAVIVYITGFKDYAFNAFQIKAFDYIMKPVTYEKFQKLFGEILERVQEIQYRKEKNKEFIVEIRGLTKRINYSDIYYFEKSLRKIKVVNKRENIEFYKSFKIFKADIDMNFFTQCHQSFIVNNEKISAYKDHEIYIQELDKYIPVSKKWIRDVKDTLSKQLFG